jgi:DNA-binding MarR family transcriptional regulator
MRFRFTRKFFMTKQNSSNTAPSAQRPLGLAYLIGRLDHILGKRLRDGLIPLGLTVPQYTALSVFRSLGSMSNAQLAERTMVSPQSANDMVKTMEARGWIERSPDPSHGRIIRISLTEAGHAVLQRCDAQVMGLELVMFRELGEEERASLQTLFRSAVRALSVHGI